NGRETTSLATSPWERRGGDRFRARRAEAERKTTMVHGTSGLSWQAPLRCRTQKRDFRRERQPQTGMTREASEVPPKSPPRRDQVQRAARARLACSLPASPAPA